MDELKKHARREHKKFLAEKAQEDREIENARWQEAEELEYMDDLDGRNRNRDKEEK